MSDKLRKICIVTGTRAEYGLLFRLMRMVQKSQMELCIVAAGMHLSHEFGNTAKQIEQDGFHIDERVDMLFSNDANAAMAKSIGIGIYGMSQAIENVDPDIVVVLGDRVEAFAGAVSAVGQNKILAHIHGGERTRGGLDESMRHAITKMAHLHFASTEANKKRIIQMGERPEHVFNVGAPGLDGIISSSLPDFECLRKEVGKELKRPFVLLVQHSVSTESECAEEQMIATLEALEETGYPVLCLYPNSDSGGRRIIAILERYKSKPWMTLVKSLPREMYLSAMKHAAVLVGNSSSAIIEAPLFHLPAVNIGERQDGRERADNVVDVPHKKREIFEAVKKTVEDVAFRERINICKNPYGDGKASELMTDVLRRIELNPCLLKKQITY